MIPELLTVLRQANSKGRIGYAHGDKNEDLPLVQECVRRGLIVYVADVSPSVGSLWYGQKRDLYSLTSKGRLALAEKSQRLRETPCSHKEKPRGTESSGLESGGMFQR